MVYTVIDAAKEVRPQGRILGLTLRALADRDRWRRRNYVLLQIEGIVFSSMVFGMIVEDIGRSAPWNDWLKLLLSITPLTYFVTLVSRNLRKVLER
jgi:hypothetical protein